MPTSSHQPAKRIYAIHSEATVEELGGRDLNHSRVVKFRIWASKGLQQQWKLEAYTKYFRIRTSLSSLATRVLISSIDVMLWSGEEMGANIVADKNNMAVLWLYRRIMIRNSGDCGFRDSKARTAGWPHSV